MIPAEVMRQNRAQARKTMDKERPPKWTVAVIIALWILAAVLVFLLIWRTIHN